HTHTHTRTHTLHCAARQKQTNKPTKKENKQTKKRRSSFREGWATPFGPLDFRSPRTGCKPTETEISSCRVRTPVRSFLSDWPTAWFCRHAAGDLYET